MYIQIIYMSAFTRVWTWALVLLCVCICLFAESLNTRRFPLPLICCCCWKKKKKSVSQAEALIGGSCVCLFFQGKYIFSLTQSQCVVENEPNSIKWKFAEIVSTAISEFHLSPLKKNCRRLSQILVVGCCGCFLQGSVVVVAALFHAPLRQR